MPTCVPGRPLVVIAGWLGCQPRSLRRYEALYRKLGFGVATVVIATPRMVVKSSTEYLPKIQVPNQWPSFEYPSHTMQGLAWDALRQVHASQCSVVLFHVFSNGGGFFWEQVKRILQKRDEENINANIKLKSIRSKVAGVVFDSCPAKYSPTNRNTLLDALSHCTWSERIGAYAQLVSQMSRLNLQDREERAKEYFMGMRNDAWNVPQLYLCSKDDALTPYGPLRELVRHRQDMFGEERVLLCEWESSPHCCHLLQHPIEYEAAVSTFVNQCLNGGRENHIQSKL